MSQRPRLYLAGPEVFLPDARAVGQAKVALCDTYDFEGVFPLDAELDLSGLSKHAQAQRISEANEGLMRTCDAAIANLTPFRGVSMDSGTAYEIGFMRALGRPVLGYTNVTAIYKDRAERFRERGFAHPEADSPDIAVEDFDLAENLMIAVAITASGGEIVRTDVLRGQEMRDLSGLETCLKHAQRILQR